MAAFKSWGLARPSGVAWVGGACVVFRGKGDRGRSVGPEKYVTSVCTKNQSLIVPGNEKSLHLSGRTWTGNQVQFCAKSRHCAQVLLHFRE
jgi:hypothetical protein